jgi:hypothetical protein
MMKITYTKNSGLFEADTHDTFPCQVFNACIYTIT